MIHTEQLSRTFRRKKEVVEAVKGVDLDVAPGELVAVLGPNGAGKSTTLRMLASLLRPTSGRAWVDGLDVVERPAEVRQRIGYIGQGNAAGHSYRVLDELHHQGRFYGLPRDELTRRAADLMTALELDGLGSRTVSTLSGGQRRRLDVAMGLVNHPGLVFLDEPSTGMDPHSRANLWAHILQMRERYAMTILLTTHYLEEADSMAERVVIIDHGSVIADATPDQLKREHADDVITLRLAGPAAGAGPGAAGAAGTAGAEAVGRVVARLAPGAGVEVGAGRDGAAGPTATVTLDHGDERLPALLYELRGEGVEVAAAELSRASLDDVFLNLTGRSLREEGAA